jgi:methionyl-tRNA formyltransferase
MKLLASPVKQVALAHGIDVDQPERLRSEAQRERLRRCAPDVLVVAAYGLILPREVLALPPLGCLNIHASLLPRWRGAAPIHRAIEAGDRESGITIMEMDEGLDTGPMLMQRAIALAADETTGTLHDRLAALGAEMIVDAVRALREGVLVATPQPAEGVTYAPKVGRAEADIDWYCAAGDIERRIRAFDPFPGAVGHLHGTPLKVWRAKVVDSGGEPPGTVLAADADGIVVACGEQALKLVELQKPGGRRLDVGEFLRGFMVTRGECFETRVPIGTSRK